MHKIKLLILPFFIIMQIYPAITFEQFSKLSDQQKWEAYQAVITDNQPATVTNKNDTFPTKIAIGIACILVIGILRGRSK